MSKRFNAMQKQAIEHCKGPLMVIAGPGSGKTTVITQRVFYLVNVLQIAPQNILVLTFSRAAAEEMQERTEKLFLEENAADIQSSSITFGTFHSVFYKILKTAYGWEAEDWIFDEEAYIDKLPEIHFDEMLTMAKELFEQREDILKLVRKRFQWILIDEFQDIDEVQFDIVKLLAPPEMNPNITIVGDDDQSIYFFRGARPEIMLHFPDTYKNTKQIILDTNYRSTPEIVSLTSKLIRHNKKRFDKEYHANKLNGPRIILHEYEDTREEYRAVVREIIGKIRSGMSPPEIAILFRTNIQPYTLSFLLKENHLENVVCMTFHRSKGLEFHTVYIIDVNEGIVPHTKAKCQDEIEEERRAFYVAMTRAKEELKILYVRKRRNKEICKSYFIDELLE